jgi:predicted transcriptional regulator of viral defense system
MGRGRKTELPWDLLFELATSQAGYFTHDPAGHGPGVLGGRACLHQKTRKLLRAYRGVYRFAHYPPTEHEELVVVWLASDQEGVFSHETALALHQLSDVLPTRMHLTLPPAWRRRALPEGIERHYASLQPDESVWIGPVRVTSPVRTLRDCVTAHVSPELLEQAFRQALARGKVSATQLLELKG